MVRGTPMVTRNREEPGVLPTPGSSGAGLQHCINFSLVFLLLRLTLFSSVDNLDGVAFKFSFSLYRNINDSRVGSEIRYRNRGAGAAR